MADVHRLSTVRRQDGASRQTFRAFVESPTGIAAALVLGALVVIAVIAPSIWGGQASRLSVFEALQGPSPQHWLGTEQLGRDILARTLVATRLSLVIGFTAAGIGGIVGVLMGASIGIAGPKLREAGMRVVDVLLAFPHFLLLIFITAAVGVGTTSAMVAVGLSNAPFLARVIANLASSIGGRDYIQAARALGISPTRLLWRHVLPNIAETLLVSVCFTVSRSIIFMASLSFLGLGVQPPSYDWGSMLTIGVRTLFVSPFSAIAPGVMIAVTGLVTGYLGEAFAHAANPAVWTVRHGRRSSSPSANETLPGRDPVAVRDTQLLDPVLEVADLSVSVLIGGKAFDIVSGVNLEIGRAEIVGIVGESGAGKSTLALALSGLVAYPSVVSTKKLRVAGKDLAALGVDARSRLLATSMGLVFQDPMASLNPAIRIGQQMTESVRQFRSVSKRLARTHAIQTMRSVHISSPELRFGQHPHELSGGMRQRVMLAMALMLRPDLIIADEPTSALDVTLQAQLMELLSEINRKHGTALLIVSHDIVLLSSVCSRILVMYAGRIVEELTAESLVNGGSHPYTRALMGAIPDPASGSQKALMNIPGQPPDVASPVTGCPFHPRCPLVEDKCLRIRPELLPIESSAHTVACLVVQERKHA